MKNKKKFLLFLLLLLFVIFLSCLLLMPHKSKTNKKQSIVKQPTTHIDLSKKDKFKSITTRNKLSSQYNDFCYKYGIIGKDNPNYDHLFDLDNSNYDCDENQKVTNLINKKTNAKLISFFDNTNATNQYLKSKEDIVVVNDIISEPIVKDVIDVTPQPDFKPVLETKKPKVSIVTPKIENVVKNTSTSTVTETKEPIKEVKSNNYKKEIQDKKSINETKFIIDTVNSKLNVEYKSTLDLKNLLNEVIPNLNIKINDLTMTNNSELLNKLVNEKITLNVKGKIKTLSIKELLLKHKLVPAFNGASLTDEQLSLYNKYQTTTDLDIKFHAVKSLMDSGIDINQIKEEN